MNQLESHLTEHHKAHGENWAKWLAPFIGKPDVVGIELGTWLGESALWWMENVLTGPNATLHCVDTFKGSAEHALAGIDCTQNSNTAHERLARFGERVKIWTETTDSFLRRESAAGRIQPSFIYVDADHSAMGTLRDSVLGFDMLEVGGVMIWDDYRWEVMRDEIDRPKLAIDSFLACYARRFEVISLGGWQCAARKIA